MTAFTIRIESDPAREVQVRVYETVGTFRAAAKRYDAQHSGRMDYSDSLGVCHRFERYDDEGNRDPLCAIVRLAKPHIGVGVMSHEMAHAAVWIHELDTGGEPLRTDNDESFCWVLGELVRQTTARLIEDGSYEEVGKRA
jgi:hypothetical protein